MNQEDLQTPAEAGRGGSPTGVADWTKSWPCASGNWIAAHIVQDGQTRAFALRRK
jgi:hypothetical protein